jgi:diadenosine tetraphosphate (Ap4A) HIT family hydrolase
MSYDDNNIFAQILRGDLPAHRVYEDAFAYAFKDISPKAPVHILVIPKGKYTDLADFGTNANAAEITGFWRAVSKVANDAGLTEQGFRTIANTGPNSGQEVPHFHVHVLGGEAMGAMVG